LSRTQVISFDIFCFIIQRWLAATDPSRVISSSWSVMAKVARAALSAVQSAAEAQQLYPALQYILASCTAPCRHADAGGDAAASTASPSLDAAAPPAGVTDDDRALEPLHQSIQQQQVLLPDATACVTISSGAAAFRHPHLRHGSSLSSLAAAADSSSSSSSAHKAGGRFVPGSTPSNVGGQQTQSDPLTVALRRLHDSPKAGQLTPSAIVKKLDKYIVGQPVGVLAAGVVRSAVQMQPAGKPVLLVTCEVRLPPDLSCLRTCRVRCDSSAVLIMRPSCCMCESMQDAKRAVAVALRNRWRRHMLPADLAEEVRARACSPCHTESHRISHFVARLCCMPACGRYWCVREPAMAAYQ
jgi:hypothetical protein